ncbi:MAG: hypothetical protein Q4F57_02640 [Weeksellaceae bacterium]|nr:hypothetical protein [Weeksellaceae bacterium]
MKQKNYSLIGFLIALACCVLAIWVYIQFINKNPEYLIDNQTNQVLEMQVNDNTYTVAPGQLVTTDRLSRQATVRWRTQGSEQWQDEQNIAIEHKRGMFNPARKPYFIYALPYGPGHNIDSIFRSQKTVYNGKTYYGNLKIDSSFYITDYYYSLTESFPKVTKASENPEFRTKIFREDEFRQFYFQHFE